MRLNYAAAAPEATDAAPGAAPEPASLQQRISDLDAELHYHLSDILLYKLDVKGARRELQLSGARRNSKALHLAVTRLGQGLYRIEVDEELDNGEYALTPMGSSRVFCFEIF